MTRPAPGYGIAAHAAITAELVRLTLGQRGEARAELLVPILDDRTQHRRRRPHRRKR